jgi:phosphoribosyl 1,2-cyclic phosphodiesterase
MLMNGSYPYHLKKRISSGHGHLSNSQALDLFLNHKHPGLEHLILTHLSKENNCPQLVQNLFTAHSGKVKVTVASRYEESPVFSMEGGPVRQRVKQISLFE